MGLQLKLVVKDAKVLPVLKKFAVADHSDEQVDFIADTTTDPKKLYEKWISPKSPKQVNIEGATQNELDKLYAAKSYAAMGPLVLKAKATVAAAFDKDAMVRFEKSAAYAALNPEAATTKAGLATVGKDMSDGSTFLKTATANVKAKGKPSDKIEVNRMFDSGRMRHDKVHEWFTERLQKDKSFTRASYGTLFAQKDAFSKLWAEYRKLLGR